MMCDVRDKDPEGLAKYAKFLKCQRRKYIIGCILFTFAILLCLVWINVFAANFNNNLSVGWIKTYLVAMFEDYVLFQPLKCLLLFLLTLLFLKQGEGSGRRWLSPKLKRWLVACITGNILDQ
jgi:hypothetical protein